jgi:hypothetical protein
VRHVVHYPPDVHACIFWLRNRRRKQWLEQGKPEQPDSEITWAELEEASARARRATQEHATEQHASQEHANEQ